MSKHKINRLRGLTQAVEMEPRQAGRGQAPWIQKKLLKDLGRETPYLPVTWEMKVILKKDMKVALEPNGDRTNHGRNKYSRTNQRKNKNSATRNKEG